MSNIDYVKFKQLYNSKELMHHGVKGQKWGVRKNKDESSDEYKIFKEQQRALNKAAATEVKQRKKIIRTAGAILIGGAIVASLLINKHKKEKLSVMNNSQAKGTTQLFTNTMQNVGKDTYVDDLLKEARRKRSTFRDMKDMLHHSGIDDTYLEHFGILGQKWGIRRFQNEDGTLTSEGKRRYINSDGTFTKEGLEKYGEYPAKSNLFRAHILELEKKIAEVNLANMKAGRNYDDDDEETLKNRKEIIELQRDAKNILDDLLDSGYYDLVYGWKKSDVGLGGFMNAIEKSAIGTKQPKTQEEYEHTIIDYVDNELKKMEQKGLIKSK